MGGANYWVKRVFAEATSESSNLVRRGLVYHTSQTFTMLGSASTYFVFQTASVGVEIEFYDMMSDTTTVLATLLEAPTSGSAVATITPRNLNRTYPDASTVSLYSTASLTGGTSVSSELVGSSSKAGGLISQHKHFVLNTSTKYGMSFVNQQNQETKVHMNLGWSEAEPAATRLWGTVTDQD
jgi:hypothetical protein